MAKWFRHMCVFGILSFSLFSLGCKPTSPVVQEIKKEPTNTPPPTPNYIGDWWVDYIAHYGNIEGTEMHFDVHASINFPVTATDGVLSGEGLFDATYDNISWFELGYQDCSLSVSGSGPIRMDGYFSDWINGFHLSKIEPGVPALSFKGNSYVYCDGVLVKTREATLEDGGEFGQFLANYIEAQELARIASVCSSVPTRDGETVKFTSSDEKSFQSCTVHRGSVPMTPTVVPSPSPPPTPRVTLLSQTTLFSSPLSGEVLEDVLSFGEYDVAGYFDGYDFSIQTPPGSYRDWLNIVTSDGQEGWINLECTSGEELGKSDSAQPFIETQPNFKFDFICEELTRVPFRPETGKIAASTNISNNVSPQAMENYIVGSNKFVIENSSQNDVWILLYPEEVINTSQYPELPVVISDRAYQLEHFFVRKGSAYEIPMVTFYNFVGRVESDNVFYRTLYRLYLATGKNWLGPVYGFADGVQYFKFKKLLDFHTNSYSINIGQDGDILGEFEEISPNAIPKE